MPTFSMPSKEDLEIGSIAERLPLPGGEDYIAVILDVTEATKPDFNGKPVDVLTYKFAIKSFRDGAALEDIEGNPISDERWVWKDIDPAKMGFKQDGTPSWARQVVAAAENISDIQAGIPNWNSDSHIGREVILSLMVFTSDKDGRRKNRISSIRPISSGRRSRRDSQQQNAESNQTTSQKARSAADVNPEFASAVADLVGGAKTAFGKGNIEEMPF